MPDKKKFSQRAWSILSTYLSGWRGELHHVAGKDYEYLRYLKPLSTEEHRGIKGHHKYMGPEHVPAKEVSDNLFYWRTLLSKGDWEWFIEQGYV